MWRNLKDGTSFVATICGQMPDIADRLEAKNVEADLLRRPLGGWLCCRTCSSGHAGLSLVVYHESGGEGTTSLSFAEPARLHHEDKPKVTFDHVAV